MKSSSLKVKRVRALLGTYVEIELRGYAPVERLHAWVTAGFEAVAQVDRLMSIYRAESDISRLNRAGPGEWIDVEPLTLNVLKASNELWRRSDGIFDIRCATPSPLMGEGWDGGERHPPTIILPHPATTPRRVRQSHSGGKGGGNICKTGPWTFDLGGIAKGFAVDQAVETIRRLSRGRLSGGIVNAGGDLRAWGTTSMPAAIRIDGQQDAWAFPLQVRQAAVATSAVRRADASHEYLSAAVHVRTLDGLPMDEEKSVTVFSDRCLWSDALTKVALMGTRSIALACLSAYHAHAVVFGSSGSVEVLT